jgi:cobaltochelatase CobN
MYSPLIQDRNWQADADFAEAYVNWGGYAYARSTQGSDQRDAFRTRLAGVQVALHNQDNREHDIFDSDDYLQFHGGMIATIRALTGQQPRHYFGDSHDPNRAQVTRPEGRNAARVPLACRQSEVVEQHPAPRLQGRAGIDCDRRLSVRVRCDCAGDGRLDVRACCRAVRIRSADAAVFAEANPWAQNAIAERLLEAASTRHVGRAERADAGRFARTVFEE